MNTNTIFCTAPFTTVRIESFDQHSAISNVFGTVFKPGCVYRAEKPVPTLVEYLDGAEMQLLRDNKLTGTTPLTGCSACSGPESLGMTSTRQQLLRKPWASAEKKIKMLDIFFGNICNLGCLMCGPDHSSFASEERYKAGITLHRIPLIDNSDLVMRTINQLPDLENITFLGGEFFLYKSNLDYLDQIILRGLQCTITTNATIIPPLVLHKLQQIKELQIRISVDGTEDVYEFIRYPAKWSTLNQNINLLKSNLPQAEFHISIVVQPLNIQTLPELLDWANHCKIPTHYQILHRPSYLSWQVLNTNEKNAAINLLHHKQKHFKLTRQQNQFVQDVINGILKVEVDVNARLQSINFLSKIIRHRKITVQSVQKQFGLFNDWAKQILEQNINETSNNTNQ